MPEVDVELRLFRDEGGGCASSDEPMPLGRQYIHALNGSINLRTAHSCIAWTQSLDSPEHTAQDGSINVPDRPCNNYIARASHAASPGFGVAPSSKTFF